MSRALAYRMARCCSLIFSTVRSSVAATVRYLTDGWPTDSLAAMSNSATGASASEAALRGAYIDLLKKSLTMTLWEAQDGSQEQPFKAPLRTRAKQALKGLIAKQAAQAPD